VTYGASELTSCIERPARAEETALSNEMLYRIRMHYFKGNDLTIEPRAREALSHFDGRVRPPSLHGPTCSVQFLERSWAKCPSI
jgi:hypothetical protein